MLDYLEKLDIENFLGGGGFKNIYIWTFWIFLLSGKAKLNLKFSFNIKIIF